VCGERNKACFILFVHCITFVPVHSHTNPGNIGEITGLGVALKEKGTKQVKEMSACLFSFSLHAHTY